MVHCRFGWRGLAVLSVTVLAVAACGSDAPDATTTTAAASTTTAAASTTTAAASTTTTVASTTTAAADAPPTTNAAPVSAPTGADGSVTVSVTVGTDDFDTTGGKRVVAISKGAPVTIEITDPAMDQEYHLHGYDIEVDAPKGTPAKLSFTADETGEFELESHVNEKVLLVLSVS
jgi:hypothetical protein